MRGFAEVPKQDNEPLGFVRVLQLWGKYNVGNNTIPLTYRAGASVTFSQRCHRLSLIFNASRFFFMLELYSSEA